MNILVFCLLFVDRPKVSKTPENLRREERGRGGQKIAEYKTCGPGTMKGGKGRR